ncbi:MAG TPA: hypothetical protein VK860_13790 [Ilumatobacteraceae bacterium]|nr:hypothetical protein [Ilumatobacteraceae bacterium]
MSENDEIAVADVPSADIADTDASPAEVDAVAPKRRSLDRGLLIASLVIASGIMLIVFGVFSAQTGDDGIDRPEAIESVQPVENAIQVLQQDQIIVDLQAGYEGRLVVDGVELPTTIIGQSDVDPSAQVEPGQQIDLPTTAVFDPGNAVLSFQPVDGALIETFTEGEHEVTVFFWRVEDGPDQARAYTWTFNVV